MNDRDDRPDPEDLLRNINKEDKKRLKGSLKIFLGMAAGVGKTYAMLEAAQKLKKEGISVVIGTIETHGRVETAKLLEGLTLIPQREVVYKDVILNQATEAGFIIKGKINLVNCSYENQYLYILVKPE